MKHDARYVQASVLSYTDNVSRNAPRNVMKRGGILNRKAGVQIVFYKALKREYCYMYISMNSCSWIIP